MSAPPTDGFVPLTTAAPAADGRQEFRVLRAASPNQARPFRAQETTAPPTAVGNPPHASSCEPRVVIDRQDERITAIHIHCSCGQVIELVCQYD
jgi:hypothetical protein